MSRYADRARFRLSSPAAKRYSDAGRKLLGELVERARSGGSVQVLVRELPDGARIRALLAGSQPIIELTAPEDRYLKAPPERSPNGIKGFVVRPQGVLTAYPEVVLTPLSPDWRARFYDPADVPDPAPAKRGQYHRTPPALLFPEGLRRFGNLDWRSADETLSVTWLGPHARYTGGERYSIFVFCHNQVLLDCRDAALIALLGTPDAPAVGGACLRQHPDPNRLEDADHGLYLYAVLLYVTWPTRTEYLVRFPLARDPYLPRPPAARTLRQEPRLQVGAGELLATQTFAVGSDYSGERQHHWMFNQSGTVAKRIWEKYDGSGSIGSAAEQTWDVTDPGAPVFTETLHSTGMWTTFDGFDATPTSTCQIHGGTLETIDDSLGLHGPPSSDGDISAYVVGAASNFGGITAESATYRHTQTLDVVEYPFAVDWRDDTPVYAYYRPQTGARTITHSLSATYTDAQTVTSSAAHFNSSGLADWATATYVGSQHRTETVTQTLAESFSEGIRVGAQLITSTSSVSRAYSHSLEGLWEYIHAYVFGSPPSTPATSDSYSGSFTSSDTSETTTELLYLWWLDLRREFLVYARSHHVQSTTGTCAGPTDSPVRWFGPAVVSFACSTASGSDLERSLANRAYLDDALVHSADSDYAPVTSSGSGSTRAPDNMGTPDVLYPQRPGGGDSLPLRQAPLINTYLDIDTATPLAAASAAGASSYDADITLTPTSFTASVGLLTPRGPANLQTLFGNWALAVDTLPDGSTTSWYGGWQTFGDDWLITQPWGTGATLTAAGWINTSSGGELHALSALPAPNHFYPVTILPPVILPAAAL